MYNEHFQFREAPFSITPDPAFVYMSPRHREALGHLLYGTGRHGGFVQLTGEVGTGKTTIVRTLLAQDLEQVDVAVILNPRQSETEFVASICDELHVDAAEDRSLKGWVDALNRHLLRTHGEGRRTVLIIDEAQNLSPDVLEQVRLLTNLETHKEKLLRIMLVGQPELAELLARPDLRQVAQRITARYHLTPLSADETSEYIRHRLRVAGGDTALFTPAAVQRVHRLSGGVPRLVNVLCDRALLGAYADGTRSVTPKFVDAAAQEVLGGTPSGSSTAQPRWLLPVAAAGLLMLGLGLGLLLRPAAEPEAQPQLPAPIAAPAPATVASEQSHAARPQPAAVDPEIMPQQSPEPVEQANPEDERARADSAFSAEQGSQDVSTAQNPDTQTGQAAAPSATASTPQQASSAGLPADSAQPLSVLMNRLLSHWEFQVEVRAGERICTAIRRAGLSCYRGNADWTVLQALNRPAILTTVDVDGASTYRLLLAIDGSDAVLAGANGERLRIATSELDTAWIGEFLLLWRPETDGSLIGPASEGPPVQWLRRKLARIKGQPEPESPSARFDAELRQSVRSLQASYGLDIDGLVGTRTLIVLNDADPAHDAPALIRGTR